MADLPQHRLGDIARKVLTLYALDRLGECGNLQLIAFMIDTDIMNYFDLQTALFDLRDAGQVARSPQVADDLYEITPAGEEALALLSSLAPQSLLDKVDETAPLFRERISREREKSARIVHDEGNEYHVSMQINEQKMPLLSIDLSLPTAELAARFRDRWMDNAQDIYEFIIRRLSGEGEA
jgi:hypothetical protein